MKTTIKSTVTMALVMAFLCPLNMAMAQKSFSFNRSSLKPVKASSGKTRPSKTSSKKSPPSRVGSKPSRYNPGKGVTKVPPRLDRKTPVRPYTPSKIPGKKVSPLKPFPKPIVKPLPKPIVKPALKPLVKSIPGRNISRGPRRFIDVPIDLSGGGNHGDVGNRGGDRGRDDRGGDRDQDNRGGDRDQDNRGGDRDQDNRGGDRDQDGHHDDHDGHHDDHHGHHDDHDGHHGGPSFGIDFPRWGFAYGPNGIFIRGGGRYYNNGPRNVVIVEQPVVVEGADAVAEENVEIREVANLPEVYVASTIVLDSKKPLGDKTGQVILDINGIALPTAVRSWTAESTTCTLPMIGLDKPKEARLVMLTAKGEVAHSISVLLMPAKAPEVAPMK